MFPSTMTVVKPIVIIFLPTRNTSEHIIVFFAIFVSLTFGVVISLEAEVGQAALASISICLVRLNLAWRANWRETVTILRLRTSAISLNQEFAQFGDLGVFDVKMIEHYIKLTEWL